MNGMTPASHARFSAARALVADNPVLPVIAAIGFAVSFQTIAHLAKTQHMPGWPLLYPVLIDVFFLGVIIEARKAIDDGRSDIVPRAVAWVLAALTVYVNAHGSPARDWLGIALHVAAPVAWITFLELTRWRKVRHARTEKPDRIPLARWVFMPWRTLRMRKHMVAHHVTSYRVAVARQEALLLAADLVREVGGKRWRKSAPALLRHHLGTGTLPEAVSERAATAAYGASMPDMAGPVSEWVAGAFKERARVTVTVKRDVAAIERAADRVTVTGPKQRKPAAKGGSAQARKTAKARELLTDGTRRTVADVAAEAGVSESTVWRIKRTLPEAGLSVAK